MTVGFEPQSTPYHQDFQDGTASDYLRMQRVGESTAAYPPYTRGTSTMSMAQPTAAVQPTSPTRVTTYPRSVEISQTASSPKKVSPQRARGYETSNAGGGAFESLKASYPSYTGTAAEDHQTERVHEILARRMQGGATTPHTITTTSPYRKRTQSTVAVLPHQPQKRTRSISPPHHRHEAHAAAHAALAHPEGLPAPVRGYDVAAPRQDTQPMDLTAWRMRLNGISADDLRQLICSNYDRNSSGSIDFCDFLALWFSQQLFQIRRSNATVGMDGKETETFEVQAKHIYRVREIFNEYEESYLSGIRYGLVAALLKDMMYDQDHEVQHYYGISTDDMVSLIEELSLHRHSKAQGNKEPRYDFAYILQLLFKYITDTEEIALYYDEGCKVFQAMRTKEYGEQPIYQNSTISTKLLIKVLTSYTRKAAAEGVHFEEAEPAMQHPMGETPR